MRKQHINKKYKDRLFRLVFEKKEDLLELYNAVNGSSYRDPENLEITTINDVIYMGMKNDISFMIGDILNLYEHQSTYNPNMPMRGFLYLADLYRKHIESRKLNLYSSSLVKLPFPKYVVFYNGLKEEPDIQELNLSEAFEQHGDTQPCLECRAVMININLEHNRELMERCRQLKEYAQFVAMVRTGIREGIPLEEAVDIVVARCIKEGILGDILLKHRSEVYGMVLTEYDEQSHMASERAEGRAEGKSEGEKLGRAKAILDLLADTGAIPEDLKESIMSQQDLDILKKWLRAASKAESIEEFMKQM